MLPLSKFNIFFLKILDEPTYYNLSDDDEYPEFISSTSNYNAKEIKSATPPNSESEDTYQQSDTPALKINPTDIKKHLRDLKKKMRHVKNKIKSLKHRQKRTKSKKKVEESTRPKRNRKQSVYLYSYQ